MLFLKMFLPFKSYTSFMRKITDLKNRKKIKESENNETEALKPINFSKKLPVELSQILKKYNHQFHNVIKEKCTFIPSKINYRRVIKKHIERCIFYTELKPIHFPFGHYRNLRCFEIHGSESFDFINIINSKLKKLKLIEVRNIIMDKIFQPKEKVNNVYKSIAIKKVTLDKCIIDLKIIENILRFPKLKKIKLKNFILDEHLNMRCFLKILINLLSENVNIESLTIIHRDLPMNYLHRLNLNHYTSFSFGNNNFNFECNKTRTEKNFLLLKNCDSRIYNYDFHEVNKIKIISSQQIDDFFTTINIKNILEIYLSECIFCELTFLNFLKEKQNLEVIDISYTQIGLEVLYVLINKYFLTLKYFNIAGLSIDSDFMIYIKTKLKRCKVIYNDNINILINF